MRIWRVVLPHRVDDALSGEGARLYGGRWNRKGQPAVYAATIASLALLEWIVNVDPTDAPDEIVAIAYQLPDDPPVTWLRPEDLPASWRQYPVPPHVRRVGARWLEQRLSLAMAVPSAVLPVAEEYNILLNPLHPAFHRITEARREPTTLDPRLIP